MNNSSSVRAGGRARAGRGRGGDSALPDPHRAQRIRRALRDHAQVERLSRTFRALGDPTRSKMVYALSLEELCVSELAIALGVSLSAASHQLRILRDLEIAQDAELMRGGRQRHAERDGQLAHAQFLERERVDHLAAGRIAERAEGARQPLDLGVVAQRAADALGAVGVGERGIAAPPAAGARPAARSNT